MYHRENAQEGLLETETHPREAYAPFTIRDYAYGEGWLPE